MTLFKSFTFYAILFILNSFFFCHIHYVHTSTKNHQKTHSYSFSFTNTMRAQSHNPTLGYISVAEKLIKHIVTFKKDLDPAIRDRYFFNTILQSR